MIEYPTEELRQVRHEVGSRGVIGPFEYSQIKYVYYKVQRKWWVQDGEQIKGCEPINNDFSQIRYDPVYSSTSGEFGYVVLKPQWRDLPEVKSEEST